MLKIPANNATLNVRHVMELQPPIAKHAIKVYFWILIILASLVIHHVKPAKNFQQNVLPALLDLESLPKTLALAITIVKLVNKPMVNNVYHALMVNIWMKMEDAEIANRLVIIAIL